MFLRNFFNVAVLMWLLTGLSYGEVALGDLENLAQSGLNAQNFSAFYDQAMPITVPSMATVITPPAFRLLELPNGVLGESFKFTRNNRTP